MAEADYPTGAAGGAHAVMEARATHVPRRYSLRWRLPLQISVLVAVVLGAFLWAAYERVEAALARAAGERAQRAADQIAGLLDGRRLLEWVDELGAHAEVRRLAATRSPDAQDRARAHLERLAGAAPRRIEIWDTAGTLLLAVAIPGSNPGPSPEALPPGEPPSVMGVSALQGSAGHVYLDLVAPIHEAAPAGLESARRIGVLRLRSTFAENPPGVFGRLVGEGVRVRVGNRAGGTWTDFTGLLPAAAVDLSRPGVVRYRAADGGWRLGAVSLIPSTPLAAWVDFPLSEVTTPARSFLNRMLAVGLLFVGAAALLASALAYRITSPLTEIGDAAAALASGAYGRRVAARRRDEIGQLGRVFNTMAAAIQTGSEALQRSQANYRRLFASNPHPMWVYDVETLRILDVNDMATTTYGYTRDEFLTMTIADLRPPGDVPALVAHVAQLDGSPQPSSIWRHRRKDGTVLDAEVTSHELTADGRRTRLVLAHDVTESLRAQQALREREALFRGMAETMPHIVWMLKPDGTFEYVNRQWREYSGLDLDGTRLAGWQALLHPDEAVETVQRWRDAIDVGEPFESSCRLRRHADGAYRWHLVRWTPLRHETGAIALWIGTSTDVDDSRRSEEALRALNVDLEARVRARTADLEAVNRELESFSYSVSHDLRAPLRHVQGYVELLTAAVGSDLAEAPRRYLQTISDATTEMGQLIDDLLALARVGRAPMAEERISLNEVVRDVIQGLEIATRGRRIDWTVHPLPDVLGDRSLIRQVYVNLIDNAVKYTRRRDPATIEIGCGADEDGRATLFVRDNGAGFDMQYAHKLFGVFQRLHRADEFEGTGVGLAIVHRIVSRHHGRTWAEGRVDGGATFFFTLTAAAEAAGAGAAS